MSIVKIRMAYPDELGYLQEIEIASGEPFRDVGMPEIADDDPMSLDDLASHDVWVVVDEDDVPVAFAAVSPVDGVTHIHQISVHPAYARRGIGAELIRHVARGPVTLTTFRDVPWNAPYYERLGFRVLADPSPGLAALMAEERGSGGRPPEETTADPASASREQGRPEAVASWGLDPARRVAMLLPAQVEA